MASMYITAIVRRRDITSIRDLKKKHVPWLKDLRRRIPEAICMKYSDVEPDQIKLYAHCVPSNPLLILMSAANEIQTNPHTITSTCMPSLSHMMEGSARQLAKLSCWEI